ncbi:hypothetical protein ILYODFUR_023067 [Ilyodon furcidens]|uniref:Uncharacterized protein n=1 Tax=Ilyodon furcidens TaxID=33524 RepID=A0ABV0SZQ8_9TELE
MSASTEGCGNYTDQKDSVCGSFARVAATDGQLKPSGGRNFSKACYVSGNTLFHLGLGNNIGTRVRRTLTAGREHNRTKMSSKGMTRPHGSWLIQQEKDLI